MMREFFGGAATEVLIGQQKRAQLDAPCTEWGACWRGSLACHPCVMLAETTAAALPGRPVSLSVFFSECMVLAS